jgi:hypothetical protein
MSFSDIPEDVHFRKCERKSFKQREKEMEIDYCRISIPYMKWNIRM